METYGWSFSDIVFEKAARGFHKGTRGLAGSEAAPPKVQNCKRAPNLKIREP